MKYIFTAVMEKDKVDEIARKLLADSVCLLIPIEKERLSQSEYWSMVASRIKIAMFNYFKKQEER